MLYAAVCEDEALFRLELRRELMKFCHKNERQMQLYEYESAEAYLTTEKDADLLFLDIEMKGIDGIALKNMLQERRSSTKILFLTSHAEMMKEAFGNNVFGFLEKPFTTAELEKVLHSMLAAVFDDLQDVLVRVDGTEDGDKIIKIKDIHYLKAEDKYSIVYQGEFNYLARRSLSDWEKMLTGFGFLRIHKSYMINMEHVKRFTKYFIMDNGDRLNVPRDRLKAVTADYMEYIKERAFYKK